MIPNEISIVNEEQYIKVTNNKGKETVVITDSNVVLPANVYVDDKNYPMMTIKGENISLHRFVYGEVKQRGNIIDHIDMNPLNAKRSNLREITRSQNQFNRMTKGYSLNKKTNKYHAQIQIDGKKKSLGYYFTEKEARIAYIQGKIKYHGEEYCPVIMLDELNKLLSELKHEQVFTKSGRKFNEFRNGDITLINSIGKLAIVISNNNEDTIRLHEVNSQKGYTAKPHQLTPVCFAENMNDLSWVQIIPE